MEFLGVTSVAAITVCCYLAAEVLKLLNLKKKWLPVICGVLGGALGVVSLFAMPDFPAGDVISAAAVGIVSGLAATGANQVGKQFKKED